MFMRCSAVTILTTARIDTEEIIGALSGVPLSLAMGLAPSSVIDLIEVVDAAVLRWSPAFTRRTVALRLTIELPGGLQPRRAIDNRHDHCLFSQCATSTHRRNARALVNKADLSLTWCAGGSDFTSFFGLSWRVRCGALAARGSNTRLRHVSGAR
jgi:hypothetical protein